MCYYWSGSFRVWYLDMDEFWLSISNLIPHKNTFATNPIHLSYIGALIFLSATVHGILRHGWLKE